MKLGRGINVEHIKRMTLRTVRERTEGQPETLSFLDALERNDFDETKCKREARHMMLVLEAKRQRRAAEHRSTLNFHVIRMMKGHHDPLWVTCFSNSRIQSRKRQSERSMDTLHAQKENVDGNVVGNGADGKLRFSDTNKFSTPKHNFVIHDDSKSTERKGLKDKSAKSRRVLSDISNKQRSRHGNSNAAGIASTKKGLGGHPKKLSANKTTPLTPVRPKSGAPLAPKARTSLTPKVRATLASKSAIKTPRIENVPDIEFAYGGLSSPKQTESAYIKGLGDEVWQDLLNDETPTLFDDFDPTRAVDDWDDSREKAMLESGEPPSLWWASPDLQQTKKGLDTKESEKEEEQVEDDLMNLPPPDNLPEDAVTDLNNDGLLEDLLSVEVEAVCSE
ncbi:hypothetical protein PC120_g1856 [Phytophthora cactorum]|nr:hypothetical protein PC120_g1856 [Phytophthora cactorum]